MQLTKKIQRYGKTSLAIIIPKGMLDERGLGNGSSVRIYEIGDKIIIEKAPVENFPPKEFQ